MTASSFEVASIFPLPRETSSCRYEWVTGVLKGPVLFCSNMNNMQWRRKWNQNYALFILVGLAFWEKRVLKPWDKFHNISLQFSICCVCFNVKLYRQMKIGKGEYPSLLFIVILANMMNSRLEVFEVTSCTIKWIWTTTPCQLLRKNLQARSSHFF